MPNYGSASAKLPAVAVGPGFVELTVLKQEQVFSSKRRTFLNLKFPDPGSKRGFWHTALEDWDHGYHSQSHGVCALQVSAGVFNVHSTSGGGEVNWDVVSGAFENDSGAVDNLEKVCDV